MYPFNSINDSYNDPYMDQAFHHKPYPNDPPPFSFSHFPSPIFLCSEVDEVFFHDPLSQNQPPFLETNYFVPEISTIAAHNMIDPPKNNIDGAASSSGESKDKTFKVGDVELADKGLKKRATTTTSKRDRHSKINTAQGPRDRRMRLSLDIARRFFGLQDILGFDKASKTVEWLLNKSKSDIERLSKAARTRGQTTLEVKQMDDSSPSPSPSSECEEVSGLDDDVTLNYEGQLGIIMSISNKKPSPDKKLINEKKISPLSSQRKVTFDIIGAKESRAKARERARERTKDKMRSRSLHESKPISNGNNTNQEMTTQMSSCCWSVPFSSQSRDSMNPSSSLDALADVEKHVDSFEVNDKLSLFNKFNYPNSNWENFQEVIK